MYFDGKAKYIITNFKIRTYFVIKHVNQIKHGNRLRGKHFKSESTFEQGIFA